MKKPVNLVLGLIAAGLCLWSGWYLLLRGAAPGKTATVEFLLANTQEGYYRVEFSGAQ